MLRGKKTRKRLRKSRLRSIGRLRRPLLLKRRKLRKLGKQSRERWTDK
jgi:hypothetical protein